MLFQIFLVLNKERILKVVPPLEQREMLVACITRFDGSLKIAASVATAAAAGESGLYLCVWYVSDVCSKRW